MKKCSHSYLLFEGKNIAEEDLFDLELGLSVTVREKGQPEPPKKPNLADVMDRRKSHATHYQYCPHCGEQLDWKKFKSLAKIEGGREVRWN